jgi:YD repeat-containing protein
VTYYGYTKSEEPNLVTDAETNDTVSVYNERGLLTQVIDANGDVNDVTDAEGKTTHYEYDAFGRLVYTTYPDDSYEAFTYDKNSNLTSRTNRSGDTIYYEYDAMNRLTVKNRPGDPNITFLYDITGRIYDVNDAGDITEYYYDRIGRISDVNDPKERKRGQAFVLGIDICVFLV